MGVHVCVFCASGPVGERHLALAREVGTQIAARGWTLVSGGGRVGMMGEVARAARAGGARTVGVIPTGLQDREVADDEADELVVVGTMRERKAEMDARSDAWIALPGGLGTLEELFEAWTSRYLEMHTKPVVLCDPDGFYDGLLAWLEGLRGTGFVGDVSLRTLIRTTTVEAALDACG
ncbi:TIGR00730 family Rossman fold protein [Actinomycetospora atypica]|uniref:Cytokinin riboside 5'-monophosphate phosphoribohydrolase n=1 Tax=Actinomycetospora atypica TaxID=1290095 RepID=A0ABV9YJN4_9PSEU